VSDFSRCQLLLFLLLWYCQSLAAIVPRVNQS
jgi:hypothetical protein